MKENNPNRSFLTLLPVIITLALLCGILAGLYTSGGVSSKKQLSGTYLKKVNEVINLIDKEYVDEVETNELTESAIKKMLERLDPHSTYIPSEKREISEISFESNYQGIGIEFNILDDTLTVISAINGGPSEKLGVLPGDKIIVIDDENVAGIGLDNTMVFDRLRGEKGTIVEIEVLRQGVSKPISFEIVRDEIPNESVDAAYMIDSNSAYIKIGRFSESTAQEFRQKLIDLKSEGMEQLILDLRNNSGGILSSALFIVDELLPNGKLVLYTKSKSPENVFEYESRIDGNFESGKLVVIINEGSASASEIVAGALQDHDRAVIVGRRSFGKGLVQTSFDLNDGSELRLTISKYFIPSGRSIQKSYVNGREQYMEDIVRRYENGEFFHSDSIDLPDSLIFYTGSGREVYGGGGIMPDIFVPSDTSYRSEYWLEINGSGVLYQYSFEFANANRTKLEKMGLKSYLKDFRVGEEMLSDLNSMAVADGIEYEETEFERSKPMIRTQVKALISRHIWKDDGFFQVYNSIDPTYLTALKKLETPVLTLGK